MDRLQLDQRMKSLGLFYVCYALAHSKRNLGSRPLNRYPDFVCGAVLHPDVPELCRFIPEHPREYRRDAAPGHGLARDAGFYRHRLHVPILKTSRCFLNSLLLPRQGVNGDRVIHLPLTFFPPAELLRHAVEEGDFR